MDFVMGLPLLAIKKSAIWVIVDRLTKTTHFSPIQDTWNVKRLAQLYVIKIVRLYRILTNMVLDKDQRFQTYFWQALQKDF